MTIREAHGDLEGKVLAYVGDGNNVARSLGIIGQMAGLTVQNFVSAATGSRWRSPW